MAKTPSTSRTTKTSTTRRTTSSSTSSTATSRTSAKATVTGKTASSSKATQETLPKTTKRAVPKDVVVTPEDATPSLPDMRKRELVDAVVDRCGIKKRYAKPAVEAALAILGEALEEGRSLQMPPLGRVKVQRSKELEDGQVIVAKVRRKSQSDDEDTAKSTPEALAKAAE